MVHGDFVGRWVAAATGGVLKPHSQAIGLRNDGHLVAGVLYEDWNGKTVVCHIAIQGRITRQYLYTICDYPFRQLDAHKVIAPVHSDNCRSMEMLPKMGFREEARIREGQPDGDIVIFTLVRSDCRYLDKERYGQKSSTPTHA